MVSIAELIYSKYCTDKGMNEMKGILAVCSMIAVLSRFRKKMFYQRKRERDKLVMSKIRRLPMAEEMSTRDKLIANGNIIPRKDDAA